MSWYAVESVDDAIDATRSFLFPIEPAAWLKLALIAIFVGVGGGGGSSVTNLVQLPANMPAEQPSSQPTPTPPPSETLHEVVPTDPAVIAAIVGVVILIGILLALLSQTLRLVLYDALRTGTVRLRGPARRRFGQALRLLVFKFVIGLAFALPFVLLGVAVAFLSGDLFDGPAAIVGALLAGIVLVLFFITYLIVIRATNEFVTPVMVLTDSGVLDAWRRFWPVLRGDLAQFGVYVVIHFLLLLAISIGQSILAILVLGIVGTVGALVGLLLVVGVFGGLSAAVASTAGVVAIAILALLTFLAAAALYLPVAIVVMTYVVSYEVSVLGAADDDLQLLPTDDDGTEPDPTASA